jgi:hypothetical protein
MEDNRMNGELAGPRDHTRRNRMIAMAAGAITVTAIVLGFAGDFLGLPWHWMRPAAELLLLAELVGLVVLERHQLFEPVHETVSDTRAEVRALRVELRQLSERLDLSAQTTFYPNPSVAVGAVTRALREALAREQEAPQILRYTRLAGTPTAFLDPELGAEFREMANATMAFELQSGSVPDAKVRFWSIRTILTVTGVENFDYWHEHIMPFYLEPKPLNLELKVRIRLGSNTEGHLTPNIVTDHDVFVSLDDDKASHRCGFLFQGRQYVAVFARWFDDMWANIPDARLVYSRSGLNQKALDRIRKELEALGDGAG